MLLKCVGQTIVNSIYGNKTTKGDINTLLLNCSIDLIDISIADIFAGVGVGFGQLKATISGDTISVNSGKVKLTQPGADNGEATQLVVSDRKGVRPHGEVPRPWAEHDEAV